MSVIGPIADLVAPLAADVLKPIVSDVGQALGQGVSALTGGALGGGIGGILEQVMKSFNPLQGLLGGSHSTGMVPPFPSPFSNFVGGSIQNNPLGSIFGGSGGAGGIGGFGGGGGGNFNQIMGSLNAAIQSGDPMQMAQAQMKFQQYMQMVNFVSSIGKALNDAISGIAHNIA
jgi:type III secretion apparatus needle protein